MLRGCFVLRFNAVTRSYVTTSRASSFGVFQCIVGAGTCVGVATVPGSYIDGAGLWGGIGVFVGSGKNGFRKNGFGVNVAVGGTGTGAVGATVVGSLAMGCVGIVVNVGSGCPGCVGCMGSVVGVAVAAGWFG